MTEAEFDAHVAQHDSGQLPPYLTCVCTVCDDWVKQGGVL